MKKVIFSLFAVLALSFSAMADNGDAYTIDDNAIEQVFAQSAEVNVADVELFGSMNLLSPEMPVTSLQTVSSANPWAAWAICWFLGEFGIHRHYMGTSKPIFGIVTIVDWVVLLVGAIQDDISAYCNNDQFFMWL